MIRNLTVGRKVWVDNDCPACHGKAFGGPERFVLCEIVAPPKRNPGPESNRCAGKKFLVQVRRLGFVEAVALFPVRFLTEQQMLKLRLLEAAGHKE